MHKIVKAFVFTNYWYYSLQTTSNRKSVNNTCITPVLSTILGSAVVIAIQSCAFGGEKKIMSLVLLANENA